MNEEQLEAFNDLWAPVEKVWGTMRDIGKRCSQGEAAWKEAAAAEAWNLGYQKMLGIKKAVGPGIKAAGKILDLTTKSDKKLAEAKIASVVKDLKKHDKVIAKVDDAISEFTVWKRKYEKEINKDNKPDEKNVKVTGHDVDIKALIINIDRFWKERGRLNRKLQGFQRLART